MKKDKDIEKELYKAFGQVRDYTLCMAIARRFYEMGRRDKYIELKHGITGISSKKAGGKLGEMIKEFKEE